MVGARSTKFYTSSLPPRASTLQESSSIVSRHITQIVFYSVLTVSDGGFKILKRKHQAKLWAIQGFKLTKMKGNAQQMPLFNITQLCSHLQPSTDQPSCNLDPKPLVWIATVLQKAASKVRPLKCSLFECKILKFIHVPSCSQ